MEEYFTPEFEDDGYHKRKNFHIRMFYKGRMNDIYFWSVGSNKATRRDFYKCRYGDKGEEYTSGHVENILRRCSFQNKTPLQKRIEHYEDTINLGRAYLEWKGLIPEDDAVTYMRKKVGKGV